MHLISTPTFAVLRLLLLLLINEVILRLVPILGKSLLEVRGISDFKIRQLLEVIASMYHDSSACISELCHRLLSKIVNQEYEAHARNFPALKTPTHFLYIC